MIRVVTWNVWFGSHRREARQRALWAELQRLQPHVICLQEMIPEHLAGPQIASRREQGWWVSDEHISSYDVVMLSRIPVIGSERVPLVSWMGRELLVARLELRPRLTISTVHLESTARMTEARVRQLQDIDRWLEREDDVLLVGDMNFPDGDRPEARVLTGWRDQWREVHGDAPGWTVDSKLNRMRAADTDGHVQRRIDRAFLRGDRWRVESIERLGMKSLADDPQTWISDHFGLCIDLRPA